MIERTLLRSLAWELGGLPGSRGFTRAELRHFARLIPSRTFDRWIAEDRRRGILVVVGTRKRPSGPGRPHDIFRVDRKVALRELGRPEHFRRRAAQMQILAKRAARAEWWKFERKARELSDAFSEAAHRQESRAKRVS